MYEYGIRLLRVVDADTIRADIDMGFRAWLHDATLRLLRINAPEMNTQEGKDAAVWLAQYLMGGKLIATTYKGDSFGRWLAEITKDGENVSDALVAAGQAAYKSYA